MCMSWSALDGVAGPAMGPTRQHRTPSDRRTPGGLRHGFDGAPSQPPLPLVVLAQSKRSGRHPQDCLRAARPTLPTWSAAMPSMRPPAVPPCWPLHAVPAPSQCSDVNVSCAWDALEWGKGTPPPPPPGRSSGMRHGWRSSSSGVRTPVRPSVQGHVGEVPATAPCSIPLHHRYRRWMGGVSRPRSFYLPLSFEHRADVTGTHIAKSKAPGTAHLQQCPPSPVPPADGSRISSSSPLGDSNPRLQGSNRLHSRCSARPETHIMSC